MAIRGLIVAAALAAVMVSGGANAAVQMGVCPFGLVATAPDGHANGISHAAFERTVYWNDNQPVRWVIVDTHGGGDGYQRGSIQVQTAAGGEWSSVATWAATKTTANTGMLFDLGVNATSGVKVVADAMTPENDPDSNRWLSRIAHVDYLLEDPGVNLAAGATRDVANAYGAKAIGTPTSAPWGPENLFDGLDWGSGTYWRDDTAGEHYCGVVFDSPVTVAGIRFNLDTSNNFSLHSWKDFDLQVLLPGGNWENPADWQTVGTAAATDPFYWVDMGNMEVLGIRCYGDDPDAVRIIAEMQVWSGAIPEPVTMSLLALGGLALLRRRK